MQIGMVGLGRMGGNMAERLLRGGHECVVFDPIAENVKCLEQKGATGCDSLEALVKKLQAPRVVWVMVPAGEETAKTIQALSGILNAGDAIIDGGNTHFKEDIERAEMLAKKKIDFVDAGTSGGVWGAERGYCLMIGGKEEVVKRLDPFFKTLAPGKGETKLTPGRDKKTGTAEEGYLHCGPVGAGHFVKMIHNGIEYGLMQAYAEGLDILRNASKSELTEKNRYQFNLAEITEVWRRGSVISSWLLDLTAMALQEDPDLAKYTGSVQDSGEGRWTIETAIEEAVPAEVLSAALFARFRSRQDHTFAEKVLSAMREKFGGHAEKPASG